MAVGDQGAILSSTDGSVWTNRKSGVSRSLFAVAYGSAGYVAVGDSGTILTSPDGASWAQSSAGLTAGLQAITYGAGRYVAVGENGTILTSMDGSRWTAQLSGTEEKLYDITYGENLFVAIGYGGTLLTSPDGAIWTARTTGTTAYLSGVAHGGGRYLVIGEADTVLTSADGVNWKPLQIDSGESLGVWAVTFGAGQFVAVGGAGSVLSTVDGATWHRHESTGFQFLDGVSFVGGQFVAVGSMGTVLTSGSGALKPGPGTPAQPVPVGPAPLEPVPPTAPGPGSPVLPEPGSPLLPQPNPPAAQEPMLPTECRPGYGPRQERQIGKLGIQATGRYSGSGGKEEFCGQVTINHHLKLDGRLVYDPGRDPVGLRGEGLLYVEPPPPYLVARLPIFEGSFVLDGDLKQLLWLQGLDRLEVAGIALQTKRMELIPDGVRAEAELQLPPPWERETLRIENLELVRGEVNLKGQLQLPPIKVGSLSISRVVVSFDSKSNSFVGQGALQVEGMLGLEAAVGFREGRLDQVGVGVVGTKIALDSSGLFITRIFGEVAGLAGGRPLVFRVKTDISGGPPLAGRTAIAGKDVTLEVDLSGKVSGQGTLQLIDKYDLGKASLEVDLRRGARIAADMNLEDIIRASAEISVFDWAFHGNANGAIHIPRDVKFVGGQRLSGMDMTVDQVGVRSLVAVGQFRLACRFPWESSFGCDTNLKQLLGVAHEVRYLAGTELLAATIPEHSFTMPPGLSQVLIRLEWDDGDADFSLIAPDGTRITPESPDYVKRADQLEAYYALESPQSGTWRYVVTTRGATQYNVELFHLQPPPTIMLSAPTTRASGGVVINWSAEAPEGSKVNLFYDETGSGFRGTILAAGLDAAAGSFTWVPERVPTGSYYIYASIDDGLNAPVYAYAPAPVRIENRSTPGAPTNLKGSPAPGAVTLTWTPPTEQSAVAGYRIHLRETGESLAIGRQSSFEWTGLEPGKSYTFTVSAFTADGLEGPESAPVSARPLSGGCGRRFTDVGATHLACEAIELLAGRQVLNGYGDGTFQPDRGVTRAEFAKMLVLTLGLEPDTLSPLPFHDTRGHWAASQGYLQVAHSIGAINGFDNVTFKPDDPVTRAQAIKIVAAAAGLQPEGRAPYTDISPEEWHAGWITAAHRGRLIGPHGAIPLWSGDRLQADLPATRAEAAILLANLLSLRR